MKKYYPLVRTLLYANLVILFILSFFIYFNVRTPGVYSQLETPTVWTNGMIGVLLIGAHVMPSMLLVFFAFSATKSNFNLVSRFMKTSKFKIIDSNKIHQYLSDENFLKKDDIYFKVFNQKRNFLIKIIFLSKDELEIRLENSSIVNFQMDKKYSEEVYKIRYSCAEAMGNEIIN